MTDAQKAEQYAREIGEFLDSARRLSAEAAQLALHHEHAEAARRYVQLGKQLEFAGKILGHAEVADARDYRGKGG
ncbi:hypothetical protein BON30_46120 [Cystobacter ferrugineus]|uniref:Uncharacterized protein n=1 Tax=Cystobacter ferrugineus TaxID=83449 RepID=A0A1L9AV72_9BACT|nr:hypothetical protein BON30_46120 [Cystobacter ferrugineus]